MSERCARNPVAILCAILPVVLSGLVTLPARGRQFAGGSGTPDDPYQIAAAGQLIAIGQDASLQTGHFILAADIDLSGITFPDAVIPTFSGTFDGGNRTIRNLTIQGGYRIGLLGQVMDWARVSNLRLEDVNVVGTGSVGAVVGRNLGVVHNCHVTGVVKGSGGYIGGLVGENQDGCITCCSSACTVAAGSGGGLLGYNYGRVLNCSSTGEVRGDSSIGGLVGSNQRTVINCYSSAAVTGDRTIGGLIGFGGGGIVVNCYSSGAVVCPWEVGEVPIDGSYSGPGSGVGGFMGGGSALIARCFWDVENSGQTVSAGKARDATIGENPVGLTTAEMKDIRTYLDAGWDFAGETENGLSETWEMGKRRADIPS